MKNKTIKISEAWHQVAKSEAVRRKLYLQDWIEELIEKAIKRVKRVK